MCRGEAFTESLTPGLAQCAAETAKKRLTGFVEILPDC